MKLRKIFSFVVVLCTLLFVSVLFVKAATPLSFTKGEEIGSATLAEGIKWQKYKATSTTDEGTPGKQVVNVATFAPGTARMVAYARVGASGIQASTLLQVIQEYETYHPNEMVIAAINGDYFDINGNKSMTNGCVAEGAVLKEGTGSRFYSMGIKDGFTYKLSARGETLAVKENYTFEIYDNTKYNVLRKIDLPALNAMPEAGKTSYVTELSDTDVEYEAYKIVISTNMKLVNSSYIIGSIGEKVTDKSYKGPMVVTADPEVANLLVPNTKVRMFKELAGAWAEYDNVIGIGAQFLKDGEVQEVADIGDHGTEHVTARHPRTSIGFKQDGSMVLMVIDGRAAENERDGVSERENAMAMIAEGCEQGFNLDGGGSSTFIIRQNNELVVCNTPSDGGLRSDSDFLLMVVPKTTTTLQLTQTPEANGKATLSGTANITCAPGFTYEKIEIYLDGVATGQSADDFCVTGLTAGKEYNVAVYFTYKVGAASYTKALYSENVKLDGTYSISKKAPTNPQISFVPTDYGFNVVFTVDDPTNALYNVTMKNNNVAAVVNRSMESSIVKVYASKAKTYNFEVSYSYRLGLNGEVTIVETATYEFDPEQQHTEFTYKFVVDGKVVKEETAEAGTKIVAPEDPEKEGYEFAGWDKEFDTLEEDITITAKFTKVGGAEEYTYQFVVDGEVVKEETAEAGTKIVAPEDPVKKGYKFTGWDKDFDTLEEDIIITAKFKKEQTQSSGMSCNFGAYAASMVAGFALVAILLKKKH